MEVIVIGKKAIPHDRLGVLLPGRRVDLPEQQARAFIRRGIAEEYSTKVMRDRPSLAVGETVPLSASPAAPASVQTMSPPSKPGEKRRGRQKKG